MSSAFAFKESVGGDGSGKADVVCTDRQEVRCGTYVMSGAAYAYQSCPQAKPSHVRSSLQ
jgi:hypothetical protein